MVKMHWSGVFLPDTFVSQKAKYNIRQQLFRASVLMKSHKLSPKDLDESHSERGFASRDIKRHGVSSIAETPVRTRTTMDLSSMEVRIPPPRDPCVNPPVMNLSLIHI